MELYIKNNVSDITYMSELIPLHSCRMQEGGLIRPSLCFRTRWTILNKVKNLAQQLMFTPFHKLRAHLK